MPGNLLHMGATVSCMHSGTAMPTTTFPKVLLDGKPVVTQPPTWTIAGCKLPTNAGGPCVTAQWATASIKVTAGGSPVLLIDSQAICAPTGTGLLVTESQIKVSAM